jgi:hypothetical protein
MKHVVALSGGKDSTAMALRLAEIEPRDYVYVCTPTGNEPPAMFAHWRKLGELLGKPIIPVIGGTLVGLIKAQNALPNWRQRWCTRKLKIEPYAAWLMNNSPAISYVGLRADEEDREGGDYADVPNVDSDFPMRRWGWGIADVISYNARRGVDIPIRSDCMWCFWQRLIEWYELWRDNLSAYLEGEAMEEATGHTFRSPGRDTQPVSLRDLRLKFESGWIPKDTRRDPLAGMQCRVCRM